MGHIGVTELIIILVIVLLIFGANRIPQVGDALGRAIKNFKRSVSGQNEIDVTPRSPSDRIEEKPPQSQPKSSQKI
jgi:sec-independent protein translocase protein TatA